MIDDDDGDGWDDDDVDIDDDDDDDVEDDGDDGLGNNIKSSNNNKQQQNFFDVSDNGFPSAAPINDASAPPIAAAATTTFSSPVPNDGWDEGDDDDLNFDDDWGDNEDDNNNNNNTITAPPPPSQQQQQSQRIIQELENYVSSLQRMLSSINAVLEFEYNTPQKAYELVEYYATRPQLAEYTRTKELQRMNYQIVLPYGHVETNKEQILANNLLPDDSLVSRASNQSLLADLLHVITGHDLIVRPQYMAICVASWCQFTIHLGDQRKDMVDCQAKLHLSLPTEQGDRLDVAVIHVSAVFAPSQPLLEYKVHKIDVLLQDHSKLASTAEFILAMEGSTSFDDYQNDLQNAPDDIFRDAFVENSQRLLSQSTKGMKSALKQMDSVMNIKGKLQTISNLIPGTDAMLAAEQEAMELAEARRRQMMMLEQQHQQQQQHSMQQQNPFPQNAFPRPPNVPPPRDPPQVQGNKQQDNRPTSILGSFVRKLADSVAIPDEDPAIFGAPVRPHTGRPSMGDDEPMFYRKDIPQEQTQQEIPSLYRREEPENRSHQRPSTKPPAAPPSNEQKNAFSPPQIPQNPVGSLPSTLQVNSVSRSDSNKFDMKEKNYAEEQPDDDLDKDDALDDGWDDDDLQDMSDDLDQIVDPVDIPPTENETNEAILESPDVIVVGKSSSAQEPVLALEITYNPEDDIIETRKRWINPRPHRPYIVKS